LSPVPFRLIQLRQEVLREFIIFAEIFLLHPRTRGNLVGANF